VVCLLSTVVGMVCIAIVPVDSAEVMLSRVIISLVVISIVVFSDPWPLTTLSNSSIPTATIHITLFEPGHRSPGRIRKLGMRVSVLDTILPQHNNNYYCRTIAHTKCIQQYKLVHMQTMH